MAASPDDLRLSASQLEAIRDALKARVAEGLADDSREIAALPAFLPPPPADLSGEAVVVDLGGTNLRAARVHLGLRGDFRVVEGPVKDELMMRDDAPTTRSAFFDRQARLVDRLNVDWPKPIGYVFSFPSEVQPDRDALLLRWTKDISIPGVIGTRVGAGLAEALDRKHCEPTAITVLNDTVAAMMGGAHQFEGPARNVVGLIAGTGTNMAAFYGPDEAPKLAQRGVESPIAVNLESGNFNPPHLTAWDDALDAESSNPGQQRFEKAVSGHYLPLLYARMSGRDPVANTGALVDLRAQGGELGELAGALLARSADLVAAGLAAVVDGCSDGPVGILAEGGLFWGDPAFAPRVKARLGELVEDREVRILHLEDANLVGAAAAALSN